MKVALLIEFDLKTGKRPGGINPRDPGLKCYGWQDLKSTPAREIRLIEDGRDISQYEGISGITILRGEEEINKAIDSLNLARYIIAEPTLFQMDVGQRGIKLSDITAQDEQEALKILYEKHKVKGIKKIEPVKV